MDGKFGNTENNNVQILAPGENINPYDSPNKTNISRTGAHEIAHTGNLRHPYDKNNKLEGIDKKGNLMQQSSTEKEGATLEGNQLDEFAKYVKEGN